MKSGQRKQGKKKPQEKGFDCIEFKRRAQARIYKEIKGMTREEELAYWNRPIEGPLADAWRSIRKNTAVLRESPPAEAPE